MPTFAARHPLRSLLFLTPTIAARLATTARRGQRFQMIRLVTVG